jgi:hypothetical protein
LQRGRGLWNGVTFTACCRPPLPYKLYNILLQSKRLFFQINAEATAGVTSSQVRYLPRGTKAQREDAAMVAAGTTPDIANKKAAGGYAGAATALIRLSRADNEETAAAAAV